MNTATRYGAPPLTHGSVTGFFGCASYGIDTRSRGWIQQENADRPHSSTKEVSIDTTPLGWFHGEAIDTAWNAIEENLGQPTCSPIPHFDAVVAGTKGVVTIQMKSVDDPGFPLASDVIGERVASVWAAVVDTLVKGWNAISEHRAIHPIKMPLHGNALWSEPGMPIGWFQSGQLLSGTPGAVCGESYFIKADLPFCEESCIQDEIASRKRNLAREILNSALERYRRPDGYEGCLVQAAWEIEQLGCEAWPALSDLVMKGGPECEHFLGAVVRLEDVDPQARRNALLTAARNPHPDVRSRLLELLEEMPDQLRAEVLRELTADGRPDDGVTDRAREVWQARAF